MKWKKSCVCFDEYFIWPMKTNFFLIQVLELRFFLVFDTRVFLFDFFVIFSDLSIPKCRSHCLHSRASLKHSFRSCKFGFRWLRKFWNDSFWYSSTILMTSSFSSILVKVCILRRIPITTLLSCAAHAFFSIAMKISMFNLEDVA